MNSIKEKLRNKTATLGVIGLGYVGLPLAVEKAKAGYKTIGFDVQEAKVAMVNAGNNYIGDVVNADLAEIVNSGLFSATTDFAQVAKLTVYVSACLHLLMSTNNLISAMLWLLQKVLFLICIKRC